jgi:hypothetical protein
VFVITFLRRTRINCRECADFINVNNLLILNHVIIIIIIISEQLISKVVVRSGRGLSRGRPCCPST